MKLTLVLLAALGSTAMIVDSKPLPEIVAHRGESHDAPENTLAAFQLAWDRNVDTIELDVHLTQDGQLIVCHDADTKRTTGVDHKIKECSCAMLRQLDAGSWKGPKWKGEKLPILEECLATIPPGKKCFVEIKVGPEAVPAVAQAIKNSGKKPEQFVIISFQAPTIAAAKKALPTIPAFYLSGFKQNKETGQWTPTVEELIATAKEIHADGLDVSYKGPVDREFVRKVKAAGLQFHVYTIDDLEVARKFQAYGVDGITTNRAAWMRQQLSSPR